MDGSDALSIEILDGLSEIDRDAVVAALARANNVVSVAARALGIYRTQLYRLMEKYGISRTEDS